MVIFGRTVNAFACARGADPLHQHMVDISLYRFYTFACAASALAFKKDPAMGDCGIFYIFWGF